MPERFQWFALLAAVAATVAIRLSGVLLARNALFKKLDEEALSRLFPLVILFVLVFKELASSWGNPSTGVARLIACCIVVGLHLWKRNFFLSIIAGTSCYVLWVNLLA